MVFIPTWKFAAFIQHKRLNGFVVVMLECQRTCSFVEHCIETCEYWGFIIFEVACGVVRHFLAHLVLIVRHGTHKISAVFKHILVFLTCSGHELFACKDGSESRIVSEHAAHIRYVLCVEIWYVEHSESWTAPEHAAHVRHVLSVEVWDIECFECFTATEHAAHVRHVLCVEVWYIECCELRTATEHHSHVRHVLCVEIWKVECSESRAAI